MPAGIEVPAGFAQTAALVLEPGPLFRLKLGFSFW